MSAELATTKGSYDKWQSEDDLRTIQRATEIKKDKKRMENVRRAAREKLAEMASLKSLAAGGEAK